MLLHTHRLMQQLAAARSSVVLLASALAAGSGVAGSDDAGRSTCQSRVAHSWETTCAINSSAPIMSDALVAMRQANGACRVFDNIVPMVIVGNPEGGATAPRRYGGPGFAPLGFGSLANETVPCTLHGNAFKRGCALNGTRETDRKGGFPNGTANQPWGSKIIRFSGATLVDYIKACHARSSGPCPDLISVPECAGELTPTAFMGWEFTGVWWDHAMAEIRAQTTEFFSALASAGGELDEVVLDTEMIEAHWSRVIAPKMKVWYPHKKLPATYPTVSDRCARARWLAVQSDRRFPALLAELRSRGFAVNTSHPEYLAVSMGVFTRAPVLGTYGLSDSANQAVFNTVVSEKLAGYWTAAVLDAGRRFFPQLRASSFDMAKTDPRWCVPPPGQASPGHEASLAPLSAVADCAVTAGGGVVGWQADDSYPTEYNSTLAATMLRRHFGYSSKEYPLSGFHMALWLFNHQKAHVLAAPNVPIKPWIFPKSVCYGGDVCPLSAAHGGATFYEELIFQFALIGARGLLLFNPWFDYLSSAKGPRATMEDYEALSSALSELDAVVGCDGAHWVEDGSALRFEDGFMLNAMDVGSGAGQKRVWRLTLMAQHPPAQSFARSRMSGSGSTASAVNVSGVRFKLPPPASTVATCDLLFTDAKTTRGDSVSKLGLWISQAVTGDVWLQCGATKFAWPRPMAKPPPPPSTQGHRYTCAGGLCVEFAGGNSSEPSCGGLCSDSFSHVSTVLTE